MSQSKEKEFQNFIKIGRLLKEIGSQIVKRKLRSCFPNVSIQDILAPNSHKLYHLWNDQKCCECRNDDLSGHTLLLNDNQWNKLYRSHPPVCKTTCSCCYSPVSGITIDSLDLTLALRLIENVASLNPDEKSYLNAIDRTRCFVDSASSTWRLSDTGFGHHWSVLSDNITKLAGTCCPTEQKNAEKEIEALKSTDNNFKSISEAENYYRLITLIIDVGSSVLRDKFMDQFPNLIFEDILNNHKHDIYHLWKAGKCCSCGSRAPRPGRKPVFDSQWKLLFTQSKSNCSSQCCCCWMATQGVNVDDTDVTLISCLLLNITKLNTNERDLVKEIRDAKNTINSHISRLKLSNADFNLQWDNVVQNIEDLAKTCSTKLHSCPQYVDNTVNEMERVKTRVLDPSFVENTLKLLKAVQPQPEMIGDIKEAKENTAVMLNVIKRLEANFGRNKDQLTREIEISENIIKQTVTKSKFVKTRAFEFAIEQIAEGKQFVMFIGLPGDGKTAHAIHLMEEVVNGGNFHKTRKRPFIIHNPSHFHNLALISPNDNLVVVLDDMFGKYSACHQTIRAWEGYYRKLELCFTDLNPACNYLIITLRKDILKFCRASLDTLGIFKTGIIIDMTSSDFCLDDAEKIDVLRAFVAGNLVSNNQIQSICKGNKHLGFPQSCKMFSSNTEFHDSVESFFQNPVVYLRSDLKKMFDGLEEEKLRFCVLALLVFHGGCLEERHCYQHSCSEQDIGRLKNSAVICGIKYSNIVGNELIDNLRSFVGLYVECNEQKGEYTFSHSSVEQAVENLMFDRNTELMISSCTFSHFGRPVTFSPREIHYKMIVERISKELKIHEHKIFNNLADMDLWDNVGFTRNVKNAFLSEDFGLHYHMQDGRNDSMSLLVCGARAGNYCLVEFLMVFSPSHNQLQRALDIASRNGREQVFHFLLDKGAEANIRTVGYVIESGNVNLFKHMLSMNINFNEEYETELLESCSVFKHICITGNKEMAELFLSQFPDCLQSEDFDVLLRLSGYSDSLNFVKYIHELGTTFNMCSVSENRQNVPCFCRNIDLAKYMFENVSFPIFSVNKQGWTNLHVACIGGSIDVVRYLIEKGLKVTEVTKDRESVLHIACRQCHLNLVKCLVEEFPDLLLMVDKDGYSNLHNASLGGSVDIATFLISKGEKVTEMTENRESVLHIACHEGHFELVKYFIEKYPGLLQMLDKDGYSNLHKSSVGGSVDVTKYLISKGVKITELTENRETVLHIACRKGHFELVKYLAEEYSSLLNREDKDGYLNLHKAALGGSVDIAKYLISKGENVTQATKDRESVLHIACRKRHFDLVKYLVGKYPSLLKMVDKYGCSNIHSAGLGGSVDVTKYLICKGVKVTEMTENRESVLHIACQKGHFDLAKYILEEYPNLLQTVDKNGFSIFHHTAAGGSVDIAKNLIAKGEKARKRTTNQESVLYNSCRRCHFDLVKYLIEEYPILLQMVGRYGYSNLHMACVGGSVEVAKFLIAKGVKVTEVTENRTSVLHIACQKGHFDLVKYLVEKYPGLLQMIDKYGYSNLHNAALGESVVVAKYLISKGVKVTEVTENRESVLHIASRQCHFDLVKFLVEEYPGLLQMIDKYGNTNLHKAAQGGSVDVAKYLIAKGEKATEVTTGGESVLHIACRRCHFDLVKYFVEEHSNLLQMVDKNGYSNLHHTAAGGSVDITKYLISNKGEITNVTTNKESVLQIACRRCHFDLVKFLVEEYPGLLQMVDNYGNTNLHKAALGGSIGVAKYLISKGEKVTEMTENRESVLHIACHEGHFELVKYFIEKYPGLLQMLDKDGYSNLHKSSVGGSVDVTKYLISKGVKITELTENRETVLHIACQKGHFDLVKYLVEKYLGLFQMVDKNGYSNLHKASQGGSVDVAKYLIGNGENVTQATRDRESVLHIACRKRHLDLVKYLVGIHPSLLQMVAKHGCSNLHSAALGGSVDVAKYLISMGVKVTEVTENRETVLHIACQKGHVYLVKFLVQEYPNLLQTLDKNGYSNLHHTAAGGSVDITKYLISNKGEITNVTTNKESVLQIACRRCHFDLVKYLVEEYPGLLQMVDNYGNTNLHKAALGGSIGVAKYLISKGEKVTEMTENRESVLHIACHEGHFELVKYFIEKYPGLLQMLDKDGYSNLHKSSVGGSVDVTKYLISKGVKITELTENRETVLHIACRKGHFDLVKYLVEKYLGLFQMVDKNGYSNLHKASQGGSVDVANYLIGNGENVTQATRDRESVLHIACRKRHLDLVKYLVGIHPSLLQMVAKHGCSNLHSAALGGSVDVAKYLISMGVKVTEVTENRETVLHIACQKGHVYLVKFLVQEYPNLLQTLDKNGYSNLHHTAAGGSVDITKYLISNKGEITNVTTNKESVLQIACRRCHFDLVKYLVEEYPGLLQMVDKYGNTNLHKAALGGSIGVAKYLISKGEKVTEITEKRESVLHIACQEGHFALVKYLVEKYPILLQTVDKTGYLNVHNAALGGCVDVVKYLIPNGENFTGVTTNGESVLHIACQKGHFDLVKYLVEKYLGLFQMVDKDGYSNLHKASQGGSVDVAKYLIGNGENVTQATRDRESVLHIACRRCHFDLVKYFVEEHSNLLQMVDKNGYSNLHKAAQGGSVDVAKYLIAKGEKVTEVNTNGVSVLHIACWQCHFDLVKYFVDEHSSLLQMVDKNGYSIFHNTARGGSVDIAKYLIAKGRKVAEVTTHGESVLHLACRHGHFDLVKYFVEQHSNLLQMVDKDGYSNLHKASLGGSVDIAKYLIAKGEKVTDVTTNGESVLHLACWQCHFDLVKYFVEEHSSLLQMVDKNGYSNLHNASLGGVVDVAKYLIAKGEKATKLNANGESVLHIACWQCHFDLVKYFVEEHSSLLQMVDKNGYSNLHKASLGGSVDVAKYLIAKGEKATKLNANGESVLHIACWQCHFDLVKYFVEEHSSLLQMVDKNGYSNLHKASLGGSVDVAEYLIAKGVKVTEVNTNGESVLHTACWQCHFDLVKYYCDEHCSLLQMVDKDGYSNLHQASQGGSVDVAKYLIAKGEKITEVNTNGESVLHLACWQCHFDLVKYFCDEHSSLLQMEDKDGYSNLHKASQGGSIDVVKYLIAKGVKVTELTKNRESVLHLASRQCNFDLVKYFVEKHSSLLQMVDKDGYSNLHKASQGGSIDVVKYLIAKGVKVTELTKNRESVLHLASRQCNFDLVKYFVEKHSSLLQMVDKNGYSIFHNTARGGSVDIAKYLIAKGRKVAEVTTHGESVLHLACRHGHFDLVKYFVEQHSNLLQMVDKDGYSNLHKASLGGSVDIAKYLIAKGEKVTEVTTNGESVLHLACRQCHFDLVKYFVEEHSSLLQMVDKNGYSNLHKASLGGSVDVAEYLIAKGVKVTEVNTNGESVLHTACWQCHFDLVKYFCDEHCSLLQMVDKDGYSNLHQASQGGSVDVAKYLIAKGEKITEVNTNGESVLHLACWQCHFDLVKYFCDEHSSLLQMVDKDGYSNLHKASQGGSIDVVKYLIAKGVKVTELTKNRESVLHLASRQCNFDLVKYFVEKHSSLLQMVDKNGYSIFHNTARGGSVDIAKYLIAKGRKVAEVTTHGESVLHLACRHGHFDLVKYFVEQHSNLLQMVDKDGYSNLHKASLGGSVDIAKYLIAKGEKVTEVTTNGESVLHLACRQCHFDLVKYFVEEHSSLLQMVDKNGYSNLHKASLGGSVDVAKYLIAKGVKVTEVNTNGESVLHTACWQCHFDLVKYFCDEHCSLLQMVDKDGYSNLHQASQGGSVDVAKYLIAKGEKITEVNTNGESVLHLACWQCHFDLVKYFCDEHSSLLQMVDKDGYSNLHKASQGGSIDVVKYLIAKGVKVTELTKNRESVLHLASRQCNFDLVKYFVEKHSSLLQMVDKNGYSIFHNTARGGSVDIAKYLIAKGRKVAEVTTHGESVLHLACRHGHFDLVKYFVEQHSNLLQMVDKDGYSNLHKASLGGSVDIAKYLIAKGEKVTEVTTNGESVLHLACRQCHFDLVKYFVEEHSSLLQMVDKNGYSNLHKASLGGSVDVAEYLIAKGVKVTEVNTNGESVLHTACWQCHFDLVKYFCDEHCSLLQMVDKDGYSNLHQASQGGSVDVAKYLIAKGEKITEVNTNGESVLHLACWQCHFDLVKYFCDEHSSLLQMVDKDGYSNLHKASQGGSIDVVKYLIAKGVKVTELTKNRESVLHLASRQCNFDLVKYFVEKHSSLLQMVDKNGYSIFHNTARGGSVDIAKYLIAKGRKVAEVTTHGESVLHLACRHGHFDLVKYFVEQHSNLLQMVDKDGYSNLHKASLGGSVDIAKYLIAKGEKVTEVTTNGESVLHLACRQCHFDLVKYFVEEHSSLLQMVDKNGYSNLHKASLGGSVDVAKYLIAKGVKVTEVNTNGESVLHTACWQCHFDLVKYFCDEHCSLLQMVDKDGYSNLHQASQGGSVDVAKYLIAKGEKITEVNTNGESVLHLACWQCHFDLVKYFCDEHSSLLQMVDKDGYSNLHKASQGGSIDVVKYLIAKGVKVTELTKNRESVLHLASRQCNFDLVKYFVEKHSSLLQMVDKNGYSIFHNTARGGSVDIAKYLIAKGRKVAEVTTHGESVLYIACWHGHFDLVKYFVEQHSYLLQMVDKDGYSNLHKASQGGSVDVAKYLIGNGENVTQATRVRESVLHIACRRCHFDLVKYFVEEHSNLLQMVDKNGYSNLHKAAQGGSVDVAKYLIAKGEKVTEVNTNGVSVLHIACWQCHFDLVKYFVDEHSSLLQMVDKNGYSIFHNTARGGSVDIAKYLIAKGRKVAEVTTHGESVLHIACRHGHFDLVKYFVEQHSNLLQMVDKDGYSNLHKASLGGSVDIAKYLIAKGEKVTEVTTNGESVLHLACRQCHFDLVKYFVEEHSSLLQMVDKNGYSNLHKASLGGSVDVAEYLIAKGVKVTEVNTNGESVLHTACWQCHFDLVKYFCDEHCSLLQMVDKDGYSNLHQASQGGSVDVAKYLIAKGEKITEVNTNGESVLHLACWQCHFDLVKYFCDEHSSLLQMVDKDGYSIFHNTARGGSVDIAKYLIAKGRKVAEVTTHGESVLHIACRHGHFDLVKYFVEQHSNLLQMVDKDGYSNLHYASLGGSAEITKYLIEKGMKVNEATDGVSVLHIACRKCHFDLVKYFVEEHSSLLQMVDKDGYSILHDASLGGSVDIAKYLIARGEKVTEVTTDGESVLHIACRQCHFDLVKYFVEEHSSLLQMVDEDRYSIFHNTAAAGSVDIAKYLIAKGEKVSEVTKNGESVLHIACRHGHFDLVQYFVEEHSNLLQMVDKDGYSNLHSAALGGSVDVVKYLIAKEDRVTEGTTIGESVLHIACRQCHFDLVKYLVEEYPSLLQMVDKDGYSNLHHASLGGSVDAVKYLIAKREIVREVTSKRKSVLHIACENCHYELVKYLVENHPSLLQMTGKKGKTNLDYARQGGSSEVIRYITSVNDNQGQSKAPQKKCLIM